MEEMIKQIKDQQEINFINIREQILVADLETVFDAENNSRYIFHYLHSMDRFYINPMDYVYERCWTTGTVCIRFEKKHVHGTAAWQFNHHGRMEY